LTEYESKPYPIPDRHQLPGPVQPGQPAAVTPVGLDPIPGRLRDQRRRDHVAGHPHRAQQPVQTEPGRSRLVAHTQLASVGKPADQPPYRRLIIEEHLGVGDLLVPPQDPHRDLVLADIQAQVARTTK